jgi:uncharacterized membrane protein YccC
MVRLTAAALASYVVAELVFPRSQPLLAPLTALLVVQLTPVSILATGVQRVVSVVAGVTVAVAFSSWVGLSTWSLAVVIGLSLLIGQLLRLGSNLIEVPISAMLVLGVGARTEVAAWQRIAETLVGAGVAVLSNLVFPPKVTSRDAAVAINDMADDLADLLDSSARDLVEDVSASDLRHAAEKWLGEARRLTHDIPNVGAAVLRAEESRKLNLRALGTADSGPGLRHGLESLEHSALAVRGLFRSFLEAVESYARQDRLLDEDVRQAVAMLFHDLADGVRAYGQLIHAELSEASDPPEPAELQAALDSLHEARARVTDLLLIHPQSDTALAILNASLLATVERLLQELDLDKHVRRLGRPASNLSRRLTTRPRLDDLFVPEHSWARWRRSQKPR